MYKVLSSIAVAALMVGASVHPSGAVTYEYTGDFPPAALNYNPTLPGDGEVTYGSAPAIGSGSDIYGFDLSAWTTFDVSANSQATAGKSYNAMTIAIWTGSAPVGNCSLGPCVTPLLLTPYSASGTTDAAIDHVTLGPGEYVLKVTYSGGDASSYHGLIDTRGLSGTGSVPTPLPAALPLFASGLGFIGFWGRRRKQPKSTVS